MTEHRSDGPPAPIPSGGKEPTTWDLWSMLWGIDKKLSIGLERTHVLEKEVESIKEREKDYVSRSAVTRLVALCSSLVTILAFMIDYFIIRS